MEKEGPYRVIGLWQVWDDLPDAPAPQERPPEALLERIAGTFDRRPSKDEAERAVVIAGTAIRNAFEERVILGHLVLSEDRWQSTLTEWGWMPDGTRRHPRGGRYVRMIPIGYDIDPTVFKLRADRLWSPAPERSGPRIEDVTANLRELGDSMGLPPVEFGPDVPFFEDRQPEPQPQRRRRRSRDLDRTL